MLDCHYGLDNHPQVSITCGHPHFSLVITTIFTEFCKLLMAVSAVILIKFGVSINLTDWILNIDWYDFFYKFRD